MMLKRFLSSYYIVNTALLCCYAAVRQYYHHHPHASYTRLETEADLEKWEIQIVSLLITALIIKYIRSPSLEAFASILFLYAKTAVAILVFMMDLRIFIYYVLINLIIFLTCPQPEYRGPGSLFEARLLLVWSWTDRIDRLTPAMLRAHIEDSKMSGITWLVAFSAVWSPTSVHLEPVFAELSMRYKTEGLRFARMDLSRWPSIGKEYRIDVQGASPQIPTFILFENGDEIGRIPHLYSNGSVAKGTYRKGDIIKAFELDMRYAKSMNSYKHPSGASGVNQGAKGQHSHTDSRSTPR